MTIEEGAPLSATQQRTEYGPLALLRPFPGYLIGYATATKVDAWELSGISVTQADRGPNARTIIAHWNNGGRADSSRFLFVRVGTRWYLDDAVNGTGHGDNGWTLSTLLRHPQQ